MTSLWAERMDDRTRPISDERARFIERHEEDLFSEFIGQLVKGETLVGGKDLSMDGARYVEH